MERSCCRAVDLKDCEEMWQDLARKQDLFMYAVVAMEANRGIGLDLQLPWPPLSKDHKHYVSLMRGLQGFIHPRDYYPNNTTTPLPPLMLDKQAVSRINNNIQLLSRQDRNMDLSGISEMKRSMVIVGRRTWECMGAEERNNESMFVVLSKRPHELGLKEVQAVAAGSSNEAVCLSYALYREGVVGRVCVLGGAGVYKEAIDSGLCIRLYVTKVHQKFPCNIFMPRFEHLYQIDRNTVEGEGGVEEEGDVTYEFLEYKLNTI